MEWGMVKNNSKRLNTNIVQEKTTGNIICFCINILHNK